MAVTGTRIRETENYILESDPAKSEAEGATIWKLSAISVDQRAAIQDGTMTLGADKSVRITMHSRNLTLLRIGLKGVINYKDASGRDIPFSTEERYVDGELMHVPSDKFISTLDPAWITEIGNRILNINSVSDEERKKSSTQSSQ